MKNILPLLLSSFLFVCSSIAHAKEVKLATCDQVIANGFFASDHVQGWDISIYQNDENNLNSLEIRDNAQISSFQADDYGVTGGADVGMELNCTNPIVSCSGSGNEVIMHAHYSGEASTNVDVIYNISKKQIRFTYHERVFLPKTLFDFTMQCH